jgi:hypothetical protein
VQRAPGISRALTSGQIDLHNSVASRRENAAAHLIVEKMDSKQMTYVVPANAGTHTPFRFVDAVGQMQLSTTDASGYGFLRSQERRSILIGG